MCTRTWQIICWAVEE